MVRVFIVFLVTLIVVCILDGLDQPRIYLAPTSDNEAHKVWTALIDSIAQRNSDKPVEVWPDVDRFHFLTAQKALTKLKNKSQQ